ncbi:MAG: hypothetical protein VKN56_08520 [Cyanobacteriota bacterium]|nr:hypothetical protein [Cyanobacteriota bacterium]
MTPYHLQTTKGPLKLMARDQAHAISSALELLPGARVLRIWCEGEW